MPGCSAGADVEELRFAFELIAEAEPAQAVRKNNLMKPGTGRSKVDSGSGLRSAALTAIAAQRAEKARGGLGSGGLLGAAMAATAEAALAGARVTAAKAEMGAEIRTWGSLPSSAGGARSPSQRSPSPSPSPGAAISAPSPGAAASARTSSPGLT